MINITDETINLLYENEKINVIFYDNNCNDVSKEKGVSIHLFKFDETGYFSKTFPATKKEMTYSYLMNKVNQQSVYVNFCNDFKKLINTDCFDVYPTSYGIGIFVILSFRNEKEKHKQAIESILNKYGIDYKTEYSDAGWVFRYKISISKENISKISNI